MNITYLSNHYAFDIYEIELYLKTLKYDTESNKIQKKSINN